MYSKCRCRILGYTLIRVADHWGNTMLLWTLIPHTLNTRAYAHWLKRGGAKFKNHSCPPIRAIWIFVIVFVLKEALSERIFYDYRLPIPACRNSPFWFHPCAKDDAGRLLKILRDFCWPGRLRRRSRSLQRHHHYPRRCQTGGPVNCYYIRTLISWCQKSQANWTAKIYFEDA